MEREHVTVKQIIYGEFVEYQDIKMGTATEWSNGEGLDINISRKNLGDINICVTHEDIALFRKIFSDFDY